MTGFAVLATILAPIGLIAYGWRLMRRERQVLFRNPGFDRQRHFHFLLPTVLGGVIAGLLAIRFVPEEWGSLLSGPIALVGASLGIRYNDVLAPDGCNGWGRVAALWLGFALLLPGAVAWSLNRGPMNAGYFPLMAAWVIFTALPFGQWESLKARQCLLHSAGFYGAWLVLMLVAAVLPGDYGGAVVGLGILASPFLGNRIHARLASPAVSHTENRS